MTIITANAELTTVTHFERSDLLRILRITERQLSGWQRAGLIAVRDSFSFFDLLQAKKIRDLRAKRVKSATILASLQAMQARVAGMQNPLLEAGSFSIGSRIAFRTGGKALDPIDGQLIMDFNDSGQLIEHTAGLRPASTCESLQDLFARGVALEEDPFTADEAIASYKQVLKLDPKYAPAHITLLYFSGGVNKTGIDNQAQLEATINAAVKANLAIYPIDARGLMADPPGGDASHAASRGTGIYNGSVYNQQRATINDSQETLYTLAADTGGKAFFDSNDITAGIVQAQQQMRSYYLLGYYTTNSAQDGKYRKITVKLTNPMSAKLEHRKGYYASKVWGKLNGQEKEQQLKEALSAGDPATDLPLALQVNYFRVAPTSYFVPVSIKIPGSVVALAAKGGASVTQFDFAGQIQDEQHAVAGNVRDNITIKLDKDNAAKAVQKSFQYDAGFTLEPGRYRLKFVVRENVTGKLGTFDMRFTIPDLSADTTGLKLSSIVWSSQREPLKAAVGAAEKITAKERLANPLIVGDEKVVPNITRVFRRNQNLYVTFDVYDAQPEPADAQSCRLKVRMSLFNRKGVKAFEVGPVDATHLAATRPGAVPVQIQLPLKDLAPGRYICQIDVIDQLGRKFAFPRAPLVVI